ncbi:MAG: InlB B-repeat-containing protein [Bacilli bacterium]
MKKIFFGLATIICLVFASSSIFAQNNTINKSITDLNSVVINYVSEESNEKIAPSYRGLIKSGDTWSVKSPSIDGYTLSEISQSTLTGVADSKNKNTTLTVKYSVSKASYTVRHLLEFDVDTYVVVEEEVVESLANTTVTVKSKTYDDYTIATKTLDLVVSSDNKSVINLFYTKDSKNSTIYFYTQGSYVAPITSGNGSSITVPANPTRVGYVFKGWSEPIPTTMPNQSLYITAIWEAIEVEYLVEFYKESDENPGEYLLESTVVRDGLTNADTAIEPLKDTSETGPYKWYEFSREDTLKISADGSTVKQVYYNTVNINVSYKMLMADGSIIDIKNEVEKYGTTKSLIPDSEVLAFNAANGGVETIVNSWGSPNKFNGAVSAVIIEDRTVTFSTKSVTFLVEFGLGSTTFYRDIILQNFDGTYAEQENLRGFRVKGVGVGMTALFQPEGFEYVSYRKNINTVYNGSNFSDQVWTTWQPFAFGDGIPLGGSDANNTVQIRARRLSYNAVFYSDTNVIKTSVYQFDENIPVDTVNPGPAPDSTFEFKGWFFDPLFRGEPVKNMKMTAGGANYYAKWEKKPLKVTFDSRGGSPVPDQIVPTDSPVVRPANPTFANALFQHWFFLDSNGNYTRFEFDRPLEADTNLFASWDFEVPTNVITYKVIHQLVDKTVISEENFSGYIGETLLTRSISNTSALRSELPFVDGIFKNITLGSDATSNTITYTYSAQPISTFTVHHLSKATNEKVAPDVVITTIDTLALVNALDIKGYKAEVTQGEVNTSQLEYTFYYNIVASGQPNPGGNNGVNPEKPGAKLPSTGMSSSPIVVGILLIGISSSLFWFGRRKIK